ncbi:MAG: DUF5085 family protein, partial [Lachnospiraceae bacterium]|nr:DUF5085 family protein [Lachnospiraceae bacterium]
IGENLKLFLKEVRSLGAHPNGPVFYALNNVPKDKRMKVEFFLPVKEEISTTGGMKFHSYYSVEQMMSMRVLGNFEQKVEEAYSAMLQYMQMQGLEQLTPPYHILDRVGDQYFLTIKIGYLSFVV